jgi:proteasome lid subunit RPN8/RPN11
MGFASPALRLTEDQYRAIVSHCYDGLPNEACGLLVGPVSNGGPTGVVSEVRPCRNEDASALTYRIDGRDQIAAMRAAEARGEDIIGCWHSHTHTAAYPSATDVAQAAWYPDWIYVLVSLREGESVVRAYRIRDDDIAECQVVLDE